MARPTRTGSSSEKENAPTSRRNSSAQTGKDAKGKGRGRVQEARDEEGDEMEVDEQEDEDVVQDKHANRTASSSSKGKGKAPASTSALPATQDQAGAEDEEMEEEDEEPTQRKTQIGEYDPNQDVDEKRKLRAQYRDLTSGLVSERARDPDSITAASLRTGLQKVNKLFDDVKTPAEAVLDSNFLMLTGDLALHQARKLKIGGDYFDTDDFLAKLKTVITGGAAVRNGGAGTPRRGGASQASQRRRRSSDDDDDDEEEEDELEAPAQKNFSGWDKIGTLATKHTLRVPPIDFMLGPLAIPQKKKVVREKKAKQAKAPLADKVKPQEMGRDDIEVDDQETTKLVRHVSDVLQAEGGENGMNLFQFIINPKSFGQTVENLFFLSFLVKENKACIEVRDGFEPYVYACEPYEADEKNEHNLKARQLVIEIDHKTWYEAIEAYNLTETVIPHRRERVRKAGKWYG